MTNVLICSTPAQLNLLITPSEEKTIPLFTRLCKATATLKTDAESVNSFFNGLLSVFKKQLKDRLPMATKAFELANGLDMLERLQAT